MSSNNEIAACVFEVPGGLVPGKLLRIEGNTPADATSFQYHLLNGPDVSHSDIILSMNFQFADSKVVMNNKQNSQWGQQETQGGMPLVAGQNFEVLILCETDLYKIALNGIHFYEFRHRMPSNTITHGITESQAVLTKVMIGEMRTVADGEPPPGHTPTPSLPPGYGPQQ